jgi:hypothetical protein
LLFIEVEVSFSMKDITASAPDPRQAEVNVEMHKKPEGVSYRLSDTAPLYALIIVIANLVAVGAAAFGLAWLAGLL